MAVGGVSKRQVVDKLLDLVKLQEAEVGRLYLRDWRNRLSRFAAMFDCPSESFTERRR